MPESGAGGNQKKNARQGRRASLPRESAAARERGKPHGQGGLIQQPVGQPRFAWDGGGNEEGSHTQSFRRRNNAAVRVTTGGQAGQGHSQNSRDEPTNDNFFSLPSFHFFST